MSDVKSFSFSKINDYFVSQVSLSTNTCSCRRASVCEHLLAVHMSTGAPRRLPSKRCKPNIGKAYLDKVKKACGTKKGQCNRIRIKPIGGTYRNKQAGKQTINIHNVAVNILNILYSYCRIWFYMTQLYRLERSMLHYSFT